jgi:enoyl-CoA hydratase/carnithine racemase
MSDETSMVAEIDAGLDDAAFSHALRKAARGARCIVISGDFSSSADCDPEWMKSLADMPALHIAAIEGAVGVRGLALLLLADLALVGPGTVWVGPEHAGLAELALIRLGPLAARRMALAADPVAALVAVGHVNQADDPLSTARARAKALTGTAHRLRQGWRAARDLPCDEALTYGGWFNAAENPVENQETT